MSLPGRTSSWLALGVLAMAIAGTASGASIASPTNHSGAVAATKPIAKRTTLSSPSTTTTTSATVTSGSWPVPEGAAVPAPELAAVSFPEPTAGFGLVAGEENPNGSVPVQLATSSNGGDTWSAMGGLLPYANRPLPDGGSVVAKLAFANSSLGFSWDQAEIDVTTDGGAHWDVLPDPPGESGPYAVGLVTLVGTSVWVAYGSTSCEGEYGCPSQIASWSPTSGWLELLAQGTSIAAMTTEDPVVDVLVSSLAAPGQPDDRNFNLLQNDANGGPHGWRQSTGTLQCPIDAGWVDSMAAIGTTEMLAECIGSFGAGWAARSYWLTTDSGATWTPRAADVPSVEQEGSPPYGEDGSLAFGAGRFWAAVTRSTLYASVDGGLNWQTVGVTTGDSGGSGYIVFDGEDGWCLYQGLGLWGTSDGGASWQQLGVSAVAVGN
jgi:hypothetical protein